MAKWAEQSNRAMINTELQHPMPANGSFWTHVKTNQVYQVLSNGFDSEQGIQIVNYHRAGDAHTWVRPVKMFMDGRFKLNEEVT